MTEYDLLEWPFTPVCSGLRRNGRIEIPQSEASRYVHSHLGKSSNALSFNTELDFIILSVYNLKKYTINLTL